MSADAPLLSDPSLFGAVAVVRQVERTIDAITANLPPEVRGPLVDGARRDVVEVEGIAAAWAAQVDRWAAEGERIRAEAKAARGGVSVYEAERKRRGDD